MNGKENNCDHASALSAGCGTNGSVVFSPDLRSASVLVRRWVLRGIWRKEAEGVRVREAEESAIEDVKKGVNRGDMDISHSYSHSIVALVTKGTLIYPISRSLQLSHNVTASCSPVTERQRERGREWERFACVLKCVRNDSSASCSPVKMTRSCQINIITIRV